eukprot:s50_g38.t1
MLLSLDMSFGKACIPRPGGAGCFQRHYKSASSLMPGNWTNLARGCGLLLKSIENTLMRCRVGVLLTTLEQAWDLFPGGQQSALPFGSPAEGLGWF